MFQSDAFFPHMSVSDNVEFVLGLAVPRLMKVAIRYARRMARERRPPMAAPGLTGSAPRAG